MFTLSIPPSCILPSSSVTMPTPPLCMLSVTSLQLCSSHLLMGRRAEAVSTCSPSDCENNGKTFKTSVYLHNEEKKLYFGVYHLWRLIRADGALEKH